MPDTIKTISDDYNDYNDNLFSLKIHRYSIFIYIYSYTKRVIPLVYYYIHGLCACQISYDYKLK